MDFFSDYDKEKITQCGIDRLSFYNKTNAPYDISVPNFTYKELAVLNKNMPNVEYPIVDATFFLKKKLRHIKNIPILPDNGRNKYCIIEIY